MVGGGGGLGPPCMGPCSRRVVRPHASVALLCLSYSWRGEATAPRQGCTNQVRSILLTKGVCKGHGAGRDLNAAHLAIHLITCSQDTSGRVSGHRQGNELQQGSESTAARLVAQEVHGSRHRLCASMAGREEQSEHQCSSSGSGSGTSAAAAGRKLTREGQKGKDGVIGQLVDAHAAAGAGCG